MQAVILAGGMGTRLRPYTTVFPKPLMPVGDMPILELVLRQLKRHGFNRITLAVSHLAELIEAFCGDGSRFGLKIRYSREPKMLSTAGPLRLIDGLDDTFLVMNGDLLTTLDYAAAVRFHRERKACATICMQKRHVKIDYGVIEADPEGRLSRYIEKPQIDYAVSMGINILEPRALGYIRPDEVLGMPDLMLRLMEAGETVMTFEAPGLWLDIGRPEDYERAVEIFLDRREEFLAGGGPGA